MIRPRGRRGRRPGEPAAARRPTGGAFASLGFTPKLARRSVLLGRDARPESMPSLKLEFEVSSKTWEVFLIALRNTLLIVLTLSFYRFWARTRVRRYLWSRTSLLGEPLEYTGTSLELLIGFVIAVALFGVPFIGASIAVRFLDEGEELWLLSYAAAVYIGFLLLYGVARYRVQRYRLSRTLWRGIRFGLAGSAVAFGIRTLALYYLNLVTLFWAYPYQRLVLTRRLTRNTAFGDRAFEMDGLARALYPAFIVGWILSVFGLMAAFVGVSLLTIYLRENGFTFLSISEEQRALGAPDPLLGALTVISGVLTLTLTMAWYNAKELRYFAQCTHLGGLRFRLRASGLAVFWLSAVNALLILLTFGFALPLAQMRRFRFYFRRLTAEGPIDLDAIAQGTTPYPWFGEGLGEFFYLNSI